MQMTVGLPHHRRARRPESLLARRVRKSIDALPDWIRDLREHNTEAKIILVGSKTDLLGKSSGSFELPTTMNKAICNGGAKAI